MNWIGSYYNSKPNGEVIIIILLKRPTLNPDALSSFNLPFLSKVLKFDDSFKLTKLTKAPYIV